MAGTMTRPKKINFNKAFEIYPDGRVFSKFTKSFLKGGVVGKTEMVTIVHPKRISKTISRNKLVYHFFVHKLNLLKDDYAIVPIDGNRRNHHYKNLRKVSRTDLIFETILKKGLSGRSSHDGRTSKLYKREREIFRRWKGGETLSVLAKEFGVSDMSVHRAIARYLKQKEMRKEMKQSEKKFSTGKKKQLSGKKKVKGIK